MVKLLTIDDEKQFTEMIKNYFEPRGYQVFIANSGDEGLVIAKLQKPDIALIDLKMPGKHGDEVLTELKTISPHTKAIMITASEGEGKIRESLLSLGAQECYDKPITSLKDLENSIKRILSER